MKPLIAFDCVPLGRDEAKCNQSEVKRHQQFHKAHGMQSAWGFVRFESELRNLNLKEECETAVYFCAAEST
eukprot:gene4819-biopygen1610